MQRQTTADVPIATYLSGGIESSAITAATHRRFPDTVAYSCIFDLDTVGVDRFVDERSISRRRPKRSASGGSSISFRGTNCSAARRDRGGARISDDGHGLCQPRHRGRGCQGLSSRRPVRSRRRRDRRRLCRPLCDHAPRPAGRFASAEAARRLRRQGGERSIDRLQIGAQRAAGGLPHERGPDAGLHGRMPRLRSCRAHPVGHRGLPVEGPVGRGDLRRCADLHARSTRAGGQALP